MDNAKLVINSQEEFSLGKRLITIGRASDNDIALPEDSNVSRYHAEIENRGGDFWLIDLGSSNGTTVNNEKITAEKPLFDGDIINFGGTSSKAEVFLFPREDEKEIQEKQEEQELQDENLEIEEQKASPVSSASPQTAPKSSKIPVLLIAASLAVGLAVIFVFAAGVFYFTQSGSSSCNASAKIVSPENGVVVKEPTEIEIELQNGKCVQKVYFTLDGEEFASSETPPFTATLDPGKFPLLVDGLNHRVQVILEDKNGNKIPQASEIALALETIETEAPTPNPEEADTENQTSQQNNSSQNQGRDVSIVDINNMSQKVLPQFSGKFRHNTGNQFFLQEVQKKTAEYVSEGYFQRAGKYRDVIDTQFIQEKNLAPPLGYILAMSRSKFQPSNDLSGAGLWRMPNDLVVSNAYNGLCGNEQITDPSQNCAAIASANYLKDLILRVFEGDVIYGVAAFGMSPEEAAAWKDTLPADRSDFWNVIKSPKQREEVARFSPPRSLRKTRRNSA